MKNDRASINEVLNLQKSKAKQNEQSALNSTDNEIIRLVHELEVHQIELEMQNEALLLAQSQADSATKKQSELYDLLPSVIYSQ
jgi:hypothetical protein